MAPPTHITERLIFTGNLDTESFAEWVQHRAAKLGLASKTVVSDTAVQIDVTGPQALIDAMALCCSLGPITSWVESVTRERLPLH